MAKTGAITAIVIWAAVAVGLIILLIVGATIGLGRFPARGELHEVFSLDEDGAAVDSVEIGWHTGHVRVSPSDDGRMRLKQTSRYNVEPLEYQLTDGKLEIKQKQNFGLFFFGFGFRSSDLELSLPQKQYDAFILKMTSGDSDVKSVSAEKMQITVTSGQLNADGLEAKSISCNLTSGDIEAENIKADSLKISMTSGKAILDGTFTDIESRTTSGKLEIKTDAVPEKIDSRVTSGDVSVSIPENDGFDLTLKKTSGSFDTDFDLKGSINNFSGEYTYGTGSSGRNYDIKITSGKFDLLKSE